MTKQDKEKREKLILGKREKRLVLKQNLLQKRFEIARIKMENFVKENPNVKK